MFFYLDVLFSQSLHEWNGIILPAKIPSRRPQSHIDIMQEYAYICQEIPFRNKNRVYYYGFFCHILTTHHDVFALYFTCVIWWFMDPIGR